MTDFNAQLPISMHSLVSRKVTTQDTIPPSIVNKTVLRMHGIENTYRKNPSPPCTLCNSIIIIIIINRNKHKQIL